MPGYDTNSKTFYGDEEAASLPEDDRDWKGVTPDDENVEIISCDQVSAIKRFKEGDLDQIGDLKGQQLTEAVDTAQKLMTKLTDAPKSDPGDMSRVVEASAHAGSSYRIYSNSETTLANLEQRVARLEALVRVPSDSLQMGGTLSDVAQSLAQKTALLDPEQLAQADARLSALVERFQQVPESLQSLPDMRRWHSLMPVIPQIAERLESLAPLHDVAARVAASLQCLEKTQKSIQSQLDRTEATQNELQNAMIMNIQVASDNAKKLTERVEKLQ